MRLKKAFNNNALLALDDNDEEVIVMGKGIAFGKKKSLAKENHIRGRYGYKDEQSRPESRDLIKQPQDLLEKRKARQKKTIYADNIFAKMSKAARKAEI